MARYGLWAPIPQRVGGTTKWAYGRNNRRLTAVVIHRMEGSLEGSDGYLRREFADYYPYPRLNASTHFGVGLWYGTPQIRQWVDTANTAWGWAARPTDTPSTAARNTLTNLYVGSEDLNWQVISVEVEGFATQSWNYATKLKVIELLKWIYRTHGNLVVLAHTDCSTKPCPGMTTFKAALPGYYANRLGTIFGGSTTLPDTGTSTTVGNLPVQFTNRAGFKATLIKGKPMRDRAALVTPKYGYASKDLVFPVWFEVVGPAVGGSTRWFGTGLYGHVVYCPLIDLKNRNF